MVNVSLATGNVYELLAFVVALFFPLSLVTWLVIDKFFASSDGKAHVVRGQPGGSGPKGVFADDGRREP